MARISGAADGSADAAWTLPRLVGRSCEQEMVKPEKRSSRVPIRSVLNVQEMTARALLVDTNALAKAQEAGDVLGAHQVLMDAFYTDVRADLAQWRESRGLPADPLRAFAESGYQTKINDERVGGQQAGWGA